MGAFQHRPEALDTVNVDLTSNVLGERVLDGFMIELDQAIVGRRIIGVDRGPLYHSPAHETLECSTVGCLNYRRADLICLAVFDPGHSDLAYRATPLKLLALGLGHVASLATHIGLVYLYRADKRIGIATGPRLTNTMQHEPRRRLRHSNVPVELHAGHAFQTRQAEINGNRPLPQGDVGSGDRRSRPNAEVAPAILAPVRHGLAPWGFTGRHGAAMTAAPLTLPQCRLKPILGGFFVREHGRDLKQVDTFSARFSRGFACRFHTPIISDRGSFVK